MDNGQPEEQIDGHLLQFEILYIHSVDNLQVKLMYPCCNLRYSTVLYINTVDNLKDIPAIHHYAVQGPALWATSLGHQLNPRFCGQLFWDINSTHDVLTYGQTKGTTYRYHDGEPRFSPMY